MQSDWLGVTSELRKPIEAAKAAEQARPLGFSDAFDFSLKGAARFGIPEYEAVEDAIETYHLWKAGRHEDAGTMTPEDSQRLLDFGMQATREKTPGYRFASLLLDLPAFAAEFFLGTKLAGGAMKLAAGTTRGALIAQALEKKALRKGIQGLAGKGAQAGLKAAAITGTVGLPYIGSSTFQAAMPDMALTEDEAGRMHLQLLGTTESFMAALPKGVADTFIEYGSEMSGAAIMRAPLLAKVLGLQTAVVKRVARKLGGAKGVARVDMALDRLQKVGWHGFAEEIAEEYAGAAAREIVPGLEGQTPGWPEIAAIFAASAVGIPVAGMLGGAPPGVENRPTQGDVPSAEASGPAAPGEAIQPREAHAPAVAGLEALGLTEVASRAFPGARAVEATGEVEAGIQREHAAERIQTVIFEGSKTWQTRPAAMLGPDVVGISAEALRSPVWARRLRWHEPVHVLKTRHPEAFKDLADAIEIISPARQRFAEKEYQEVFGEKLSAELLAEEGLAYRAEGLWDFLDRAATPEGLAELEKAAQVPSVWRRLVNGIRRMLGMKVLDRGEAMTALEVHRALGKLRGPAKKIQESPQAVALPKTEGGAPFVQMPTEAGLFGEVEREARPRAAEPEAPVSQGALFDVQPGDLPGQTSLLEAIEAAPKKKPETIAAQFREERRLREKAGQRFNRRRYPSGSPVPKTPVDYVVAMGGLKAEGNYAGELRRLSRTQTDSRRYPSGFFAQQGEGVSMDAFAEELTELGFVEGMKYRTEQEGARETIPVSDVLEWLEQELSGGGPRYHPDDPRAARDLDETIRRSERTPNAMDVAEREPGSDDEPMDWGPSVQPTDIPFAAAPPFFSRMLRAVESSSQAKFNKEQARALLTKATKVEEFEWLGFDAWWGDRGRITKEELASFVAAHGIRVEEVTLGGYNAEADRATVERWMLAQHTNVPFDNINLAWLRAAGAPENVEAAFARTLLPSERGEPDAKFPQYQLPGGEGYRELLLTLPVRDTFTEDERVMIERGVSAGLERAEAERHVRLYREEERGEASPTFHGPHFSDTPNVIAWIRFSIRTDAQGRRVLFLEEIQSDWHQKGRKKGYNGDGKVTRYAIRRGGDKTLAYYDTREQAQEWLDRARSASRSASAELAIVEVQEERPGRVPDAPFKTTWPELAFKRAVKWAADNGFDAVGWTTGLQQVERYQTELRQRVDEIEWERIEGGNTIVAASKGGRQVWQDHFNERGVSTTAKDEDGDDQTLEDFLGKTIAKRVIEEPTGSVSGDNLTIGGKGMETFYDQMIPNVARSLGKRFGARVERGEIETEGMGHEAEEEVPISDDGFVLRPVHLLPLPPAMRAEVSERGFPLFAAAPPPSSPEFKRWFGASKVVGSDGEPLVVYHGTPVGGFNAFDPDAIGGTTDSGWLGRGHYFTTDTGVSDWYASHTPKRGDLQPNVLPVYLSIQNPLRMVNHMGKGKTLQAAEALGIPVESLRPMDGEDRARAIHDAAIAQGYDGVALEYTHNPPSVEWVAFRPNQVKSALSNTKFDPTSPDIRFAAAGEAALRLDLPLSEQSGRVRMGIETLAQEVVAKYDDRIKAVASAAGEDTPEWGDLNRGPRGNKADELRHLRKERRRWVRRSHLFLDSESETPVRAKMYRGEGEAIYRSLREELGDGLQAALERVGIGHIAANADDTGLLPERSIRAPISEADDILPRFAAAPPQIPGTYELPPERLRDKITRAIVDRYERIYQQEERITGKRGDVTSALRRFPGQAGERIAAIEKAEMEPLFKHIADHKLDREELGLYAYAKTAPGRNALMLSREPDKFDPEGADDKPTGSGMKTSEARAIIQRVENGPLGKEYLHVYSELRAMAERSLDERVADGLLTQEEADAYRKAHPDYLPLRTAMGGSLDYRRGQGFTVSGRESKRAKGRGSMADSPVTFVMLQRIEGAVRGSKNVAAQPALAMFEQHPDPHLWTVEKKPKKGQLTDELGEPLEGPQPGLPERTWSIKRDGVEYQVTFKDPMLARALKNLGVEGVPAYLRHVGQLTRLVAKVNTSWSPEFMLGNLPRDVQTALVHAAGENGMSIAKTMVRRVLPSMRAAFRVEADPKAQGKLEDHYREMREVGGTISFYGSHSFESLDEQAERTIKQFEQSPKDPRRALRSLGKLVERTNKSVENATRLAFYSAMRDAGVLAETAALAARELTIDFNRKGEMSASIGALWMFFNAGVGGTYRLTKAIAKSKKIQAIVGGIVVSGALMELANLAAGGEDDDGVPWYDKIPDHVKERNWIVMIPGGNGKHIKIPMPYGYNLFHNAGRLTMEAMRGHKTAAEAAGRTIAVGFDSFNPLGSASTLLQWLAPTVVDPAVQIGENVAWYGGPVMPEQNPFGAPVPDSQRAFKSINPGFKGAAELLNGLTGGDEVEPGLADVSPESLELWYDFLTGDIGRSSRRIVDLVRSPWAEEPVEINDVPLVRRLLGEPDAHYDQGEFYDNMRELEMIERRVKDYRERRDHEGLRAFVSEHRAAVALAARADRTRSLVKKQPEDMAARTMRRFNRLAEEALQ